MRQKQEQSRLDYERKRNDNNWQLFLCLTNSIPILK